MCYTNERATVMLTLTCPYTASATFYDGLGASHFPFSQI